MCVKEHYLAFISFIIIQRNKRCSHQSQEWKGAHGIKKLNWPLNSMESCETPHNREEMALGIQQTWQWVSRDIFDVLISTMPQKIQDVVLARGGTTQ